MRDASVAEYTVTCEELRAIAVREHKWLAVGCHGKTVSCIRVHGRWEPCWSSDSASSQPCVVNSGNKVIDTPLLPTQPCQLNLAHPSLNPLSPVDLLVSTSRQALKFLEF